MAAGGEVPGGVVAVGGGVLGDPGCLLQDLGDLVDPVVADGVVADGGAGAGVGDGGEVAVRVVGVAEVMVAVLVTPEVSLTTFTASAATVPPEFSARVTFRSWSAEEPSSEPPSSAAKRHSASRASCLPSQGQSPATAAPRQET